MRILAAVLAVVVSTMSLAIAGPDDDRKRDRIQRALTIVEELHLDEATTAKLFPLLSAYEQERDKLLDEHGTLSVQLVTTSDPLAADKLLDRSLATQRALIAAETKFVTKLRKLLSADQAARARVILMLPDVKTPTPAAVAIATGSPVPATSLTPEMTAAADVAPPPYDFRRTPRHDPSGLFPPGSPLIGPCDPFAQMHRCPD